MTTLAFMLAAIVTPPPGIAPGDSLSIRLMPNDAAPSIEWVSFTATGRQLASGVAPEELLQGVDGNGVIYCATDRTRWLRLEVAWRGASMNAAGPCTKVTASQDGRLSTVGVEDPRGSGRRER
jgi:hypothetical protein